MKALEEKAANANIASHKAEEQLKRLKDLIVKGGVRKKNTASRSAGKLLILYFIFNYNNNDQTIQTGAVTFSLSNLMKSRNCCYSDGCINGTKNSDPQQLGPYSSPARGGYVTKLHTQTEMKLKRTKQPIHLMPKYKMTNDVGIGLLHEGLAFKSTLTANLKAKLDKAEQQAQSASEKLHVEQREKEVIRLSNIGLESQVALLKGQLFEKKEEATAKEAEALSSILQLPQEVSEFRAAKAAAENCASTLEVSFGVESLSCPRKSRVPQPQLSSKLLYKYYVEGIWFGADENIMKGWVHDTCGYLPTKLCLLVQKNAQITGLEQSGCGAWCSVVSLNLLFQLNDSMLTCHFSLPSFDGIPRSSRSTR
jgi:hypothetical protein